VSATVRPPEHRDELALKELLPFGLALLVLFVILLLEATPLQMRLFAAFSAVISARFALVEVVNEQYRRLAKRDARPDDDAAFSARAFLAKQQARLWGLLTVTATGASFLGDYRGLWTVGILLTVVGTVLLSLARAVQRHPLPEGLTGRHLEMLGAVCLVGATAALLGGVLST
jgi:hypothetical protein